MNEFADMTQQDFLNSQLGHKDPSETESLEDGSETNYGYFDDHKSSPFWFPKVYITHWLKRLRNVFRNSSFPWLKIRIVYIRIHQIEPEMHDYFCEPY